MEINVRETLTQVAVDTLEQLAFMFAYAAEAEQDPTVATDLAADVAFSGPLNGGLMIATTESVLRELTVNMLGLDDEEDTSLEQRQDALRETINIICGNLLPLLADAKAVFDIGHPQVGGPQERQSAWNREMKQIVSVLDVDDERCSLILFLEEPLPDTLTVT